MLAGVGVTLAVALLAGTLAVVSRNEATAQRQTATAQRLAAAAQTKPYLADRMLTAVEAVRTEESPETLGSLLSVVAGAGPVVERFDSDVALMGLDAAPDGRYALATAAFEDLHRLDMVTGQHEVLWSADKANLLKPRVSPDGRFVAFQQVSMTDGNLSYEVVEVASGDSVWSASPDMADVVKGGFDFTSRPGELAIALRTGLEVHRFDGASGDPVTLEWPQELEPVPDFVLLHRAFDGHLLLAATPGRPAWLVDLATGRVTEVDDVGNRGEVSPDGRRVVSQVGTGPDDRGLPGDALLLVDLTEPEADPVALPFGRVLTDSAFTPDGRTLLAGTEDGAIEVIDVERRVAVESWAGHGGLVQGVTISADGRTAWSAGRDGGVIGWDLDGGRRHAVTRPLPGLTVAGNVSDDGRVAALWDWGSPDAPARLSAVDLATREVLAGPFPPISDAGAWQQTFAGAITPDGRTLMVALGLAPENPVTTLQLVDVATGEERAEVELPWWVHGVDVASDGRTAVAAGVGGVAVVDLATAEVTAMRDLPRADVPHKPDSAQISPDGKLVALARNESVVVLDVATLDEVTSWPTAEYDGVLAMQWLPDSRTLAYGGVLGTLSFRSIPDGKLLDQPRKIASGFLLDLEASPDGSLLASADTDGTVMLWDAATRQQVGQPLTHSGLPWAWLAFAPNGRAVDVFLENATSVRYDLETEQLIARACAVAGREPTPAEWAAMHGDLPRRPTCGHLAVGDLLARD
jgi:WD40 repeat protein